MLKLASCIFILNINLCLAQTVTAYVSVADDKFSIFEKEMISSILQLHNLKFKDSLKLEVKKISFSNLFPEMDKYNSNSNVLAIQTISINSDRLKKYDFSQAYMVNKYSILSVSKQNEGFNINNPSLVYGAEKGTIYEDLLKMRKKKFKQIYSTFDSKPQIILALNNNKIDLWLTDYIDIWVYNLNMVNELETKDIDKLGILFTKNSMLKKRLDKTLEYYFRSSAYYLLIKQFLGDEAVNYFKSQK